MTRFALTIFLGAFLLFQVQPILGKYIVPWFGGSMSVWTTCMLFFQLMLLVGYVYAHLLSTRLSRSRQVAVHVSLVGASLLTLPISPSGAVWRPDATEAPTASILVLLLVQVGLPYLLLSSTGPLLQSWFKQVYPTRSPYRLYSLSNAGSLLALVSYPFVVEANLTLRMQGWVWAVGYLAFAAACAAAAWRLRACKGESSAPPAHETPRADHPRAASLGTWTALAAAGSVLLLATTAKLCEDVAATPLLWVLPLAVYLITFVICFDHDRWYDRRVFVPVLVCAAVVLIAMPRAVHPLPVWAQATALGAVLFVACMVCHGELVRSRPQPRHLTTFYLTIAGGGALGGVFTALVAPLLFIDYWEYQLGLLAAVLLAVVCVYRERRPEPTRAHRWVWITSYVGLVALGAGLAMQVVDQRGAFVESSRNFYGVLRVQLVRDPWGNPMAEMVHGQTTHGTQFYEPDRRSWPTTYYGWEGGAGVAVAALRDLKAADAEPAGLRIGVIGLGVGTMAALAEPGLGVGTMAALAEPGDYLRFYEINPEVERLARRHFSFLAETPARTDVVIGDARIMLQREAEQHDTQAFDLLVVDAFNSDSIPLHLLTAEALAIYQSHLAPKTGVLAFHISNRHLDLVPVLRGLARHGGHELRLVFSPDEKERAGTYKALWGLMTSNGAFLEAPEVLLAAEPAADGRDLLWTDDFTTLLPVIQLGEPRLGRWERSPNQGRFVLDWAELISRPDEDRLLGAARSAYAATAGASPLFVVTAGGLPPEFAGTDGLQRYRRDLFGKLQLAEDSRGLMLLFYAEPGTAQASIEFGGGWQDEERSRARARLSSSLQGAASFSDAVVTASRDMAEAIAAEATAASPR